MHPAPWPAFGSYPNFGPGHRTPYSITELATSLRRALETALDIATVHGLRAGNLDPKNPFKASRNLFGGVLPAWGFRVYCIRNAHFSTQACTLIAKVMMAINLLDNDKVHPIAMSTLKCMFISRKEYGKDYENEKYEKKYGRSRTWTTQNRNIANEYRAAYSTPNLFGEWLMDEVGDQCDATDNEFAQWVAQESIEGGTGHYKTWIEETMSRKVVECVTEALVAEYDNLVNTKRKSKQQKEEEEKEKAREKRRRHSGI